MADSTADHGAPVSAANSATEAWEGLEHTSEFRDLVAARWRFAGPATVFFLVFYFLLPILNGTASGFMRTEVFGHINIAYLFALSQFVVAWLLAYAYMRRARVFDAMADKVRRLAAGRVRGAA